MTTTTKPQSLSTQACLKQASKLLLEKKLITYVIFGIGSIMALNGCQKPPQYEYIEGETMGTSYHIRYQIPNDSHTDHHAIEQAIERRLIDINNSMSTYQEDSIISKFNRLDVGQSMQVDDDFVKVFQDAEQVYKLSDGAFDPTVMPLIELWGFGKIMTVDRLENPPTATEIANAKQFIDFNSIQLSNHTITKTKTGVALDFSAIAKGYGVDAIADVLHSNYKINNYMVEIGGEVASSGVNQNTQPWQIAIDAPVINSSVNQRFTIAAIRQPRSTNKLHLATSGNYRNSIIYNNKRYSHTIDPTTGQPIVGGAPSVSVVAETVSIADAWATALTAMPYEKALKIATENNVAALFVIPKDGEIHDEVPNMDDLNSNNTNPAVYWQTIETPTMKAIRSNKQ